MTMQKENCYTKRIREIFNVEKLQEKVNQSVYDMLEGFIDMPCAQIEEMVSGAMGDKIPKEVSELFDIDLPSTDDDDYFDQFVDQYEPCLNEALRSLIHIPRGFFIQFGYYDADGSYGINLMKSEI